jgi:hypothetical protein
VYRGDDPEDVSSPIMELKKRSDMFERFFGIELQVPDLPDDEEISALLALIVLVLRERD